MKIRKKHPHRPKKDKAARRIAMIEQSRRDARVSHDYGDAAHLSCGRKVRYRTKSDALAFASRYVMRGAPMLMAYRCQYCGGWHLSSKPHLYY